MFGVKMKINRMYFCFPKDISDKDIIDYGYSTCKEITRKRYKNFKRNYINKNEI